MQTSYLKKALALADERRGFCAPNPAVGALIVKSDRVIAIGTHWGPGHPHAEVVALHQAGGEANGATMYVTLEPCCHWGKTPPCTNQIIAAGIQQVFYAYQDPNPQVAGAGAAQLRAAGIHCEQIVLPEIDAFYQSYAHWTLTHRPWITVKLAMTLDARVAWPGYRPAKITGPILQAFTHQKRKSADAILTTSRTINLDNPAMNVRLGDAPLKKPLFILDRTLALKAGLKIYQTTGPITVFYAARFSDPIRLADYQSHGVHCVVMPEKAGSLDLSAILDHLGQLGLHDIWVEAGPRCFNAFVQEGLAQSAYLYLAPIRLGVKAIPAFTPQNDLFRLAKSYHWFPAGRDCFCTLQF